MCVFVCMFCACVLCVCVVCVFCACGMCVRVVCVIEFLFFLNEEALDVVLESVERGLELRSLGHGDGGSNDGAGNTTGPTKRSLGLHKDVRDVLVLTEEGDVHQDLDGLGISGHHNQLGNTTVQRLGGCNKKGKEYLSVHCSIKGLEEKSLASKRGACVCMSYV